MTDAAPISTMATDNAQTSAPPELALALTRLQALQAAQAPARAPLDWHFATVLAQRTQTESGALQARLTTRLTQSIDELQARMGAAAVNAADLHTSASASAPATPSPLAQLLHAMGVALAAPLHSGSPIEPRANAKPASALPPPRPELKSVGRMRKTISRLKARQQVTQALAQAPEHAGPINSQMLVLRSLALMQDISPEYLHRFMSHVDALMTLEDAQRLPAPRQVAAKTPKATGKVDAKAGKKRPPR